MKSLTRLTVCGSLLILGGCSALSERMFAHYVLSEQFTLQTARLNAAVNACLAHNVIDKNKAYAFSNASASLLDISVVDRDFYSKSYAEALSQLAGSSGEKAGCAMIERDVLEKATRHYTERYLQVSSSLAVARNQERQQMTEILNTFGSNMTNTRRDMAYTSLAAEYGWPKFSYNKGENEAANYIVNTSRGNLQCRVTSKNYVFCM